MGDLPWATLKLVVGCIWTLVEHSWVTLPLTRHQDLKLSTRASVLMYASYCLVCSLRHLVGHCEMQEACRPFACSSRALMFLCLDFWIVSLSIMFSGQKHRQQYLYNFGATQVLLHCATAGAVKLLSQLRFHKSFHNPATCSGTSFARAKLLFLFHDITLGLWLCRLCPCGCIDYVLGGKRFFIFYFCLCLAMLLNSPVTIVVVFLNFVKTLQTLSQKH